MALHPWAPHGAICVIRPHPRHPRSAFATRPPSGEGNFGDSVLVHNVRNAHYRTAHDFDVAWEDRACDLRAIESVWFVVEPFSVKVLLPAYAAQLAYRIGLLDTTVPFDTLRARAKINARAASAKDSADFSRLIREQGPGTGGQGTGTRCTQFPAPSLYPPALA